MGRSGWHVLTLALKQNISFRSCHGTIQRWFLGPIMAALTIVLAIFDSLFFDYVIFEQSQDFIETMEALADVHLPVYISAEKEDWFATTTDPVGKAIASRGVPLTYDILNDPRLSWELFRNISAGEAVSFRGEVDIQWEAIEYHFKYPHFTPNIHVSGPSGVISPVFIPFAQGSDTISLDHV